MAESIVFGDLLDDPDRLFTSLHTVLFGMGAANLVLRAGIVERLLAGPATTEELAALGQVPQGELARVLDFLVGHAVLARQDDGHWLATPRTARLFEARGYLANCESSALMNSAWLPALRAGHSNFAEYFGQPVFAYFAANPERGALFGEFMGWMTRRVIRFLFASHRFQPFVTVADIGGSMGDLLLAVLAEYPGTRGVLFDLPETLALARPVIAASPLAERVDLVEGTFFEAVPVADLYLMKQILHDWTDEECRTILATVRRVIPARGRLVVIDHILSDPPAPDEAQSTDLAMMAWAGGRERKLAEFAALFAATGFAIERVSRNPAGHSVIEVCPV
ncbi:methyltransferase [Alteraurantiacibacter buctensis]|uniref:O-methyltransferase C-terminal domain-containing protein n=1 Tax=Alteraurantiacibacter buctensis TaxID=1503981 RepID=A0A844YUX7_9SPHN|nr:hypothetical protein [Alteraurantiacibacter buctensis]